MMTNGDHEGRIFFLSHSHMINGLFFLLTTNYLILYWKKIKRLPENLEYTEMQHSDVTGRVVQIWIHFKILQITMVFNDDLHGDSELK